MQASSASRCLRGDPRVSTLYNLVKRPVSSRGRCRSYCFAPTGGLRLDMNESGDAEVLLHGDRGLGEGWMPPFVSITCSHVDLRGIAGVLLTHVGMQYFLEHRPVKKQYAE